MGKKRKEEGKHKSSTIWLGNKLGRKTDGAESFLSRPTNFFFAQKKTREKMVEVINCLE